MNSNDLLRAARRSVRRLGSGIAVGVVLSIASMSSGLGALPAGAQTPTLALNATTLPAGQASTVTVFGSSYLVPPHATDKNVFGGVYVMFGWVAPGATWGPSNRNGTNSDGQFGITYSYVGENRGADTRDDGTGFNRFVAFTRGEVDNGTTAFGMTMDPAFPDNSRGSWSTTITVPGSTFQWVDPATNSVNTVDCLRVQCGIYTIGAHGKASATNERFTPLTFSTGGGPAVTIPPTATPSPGGSTGGGTAPVGGGGQPSVNNPAVVGGSSQNRSTTTVKQGGTTATTAPGSTAPAETVPAETTVVPAETTVVPEPTTSVPESSTTTRRSSTGDDGNSASGRVLVFDAAEDDGVDAWVWGAAVGTPVLAAGGVLLWRRRLA